MGKIGRPRNTSKTKRCSKCEKNKSRKYFYSTSSYCKKCQRKEVMKNQKAKADYYNQYRTEYSKLNPDKRDAWKKAFIENWEKENGMKYSDYALQKTHERLENNPEYAAKVREQRKVHYRKNRDKYKQFRKAYYAKNRELLLLQGRLRHYNKRMAIAIDSKLKKSYSQRIKIVQTQIKELKKKAK